MQCRLTLPLMLVVLMTLAGLQTSQLRAADKLPEQLGVSEVFTGDLPEMRQR